MRDDEADSRALSHVDEFMALLDSPLLDTEALAKLTGQDGAFTLRSRQFRQRASTTFEPLKASLSTLAEAVTALSSGKRRNPKLAENVRLIALNLYSAYRQNTRLCTAMPMSMPWYSAKSPRNPVLSYRLTVEQAWRGIETLGLGEVIRKGSPWGGTYSLVRATPALAEYLERTGDVAPPSALRMASAYDPIVLKGPKPAVRDGSTDENATDDNVGDGRERPILFAETADTERMRANVMRINIVNTPERIHLPDLSDTERYDLFDALYGPDADA